MGALSRLAQQRTLISRGGRVKSWNSSIKMRQQSGKRRTARESIYAEEYWYLGRVCVYSNPCKENIPPMGRWRVNLHQLARLVLIFFFFVFFVRVMSWWEKFYVGIRGISFHAIFLLGTFRLSKNSHSRPGYPRSFEYMYCFAYTPNKYRLASLAQQPFSRDYVSERVQKKKTWKLDEKITYHAPQVVPPPLIRQVS